MIGIRVGRANTAIDSADAVLETSNGLAQALSTGRILLAGQVFALCA